MGDGRACDRRESGMSGEIGKQIQRRLVMQFHFLERNNVGVHFIQHRQDSLGQSQTIRSDAAMDIVSRQF